MGQYSACPLVLCSSGPPVHESSGPLVSPCRVAMPHSPSLSQQHTGSPRPARPHQATYINARPCPRGDLSGVCSSGMVLTINTPPSGISGLLWRSASGRMSPGLAACKQPSSPTRSFRNCFGLRTHKCPGFVPEGFTFKLLHAAKALTLKLLKSLSKLRFLRLQASRSSGRLSSVRQSDKH